jgi:hypothetical protein
MADFESLVATIQRMKEEMRAKMEKEIRNSQEETRTNRDESPGRFPCLFNRRQPRQARSQQMSLSEKAGCLPIRNGGWSSR